MLGQNNAVLGRRSQRFKSVDAEFVQLMRRVAHKPNIMEASFSIAKGGFLHRKTSGL